MGPNQVTNFYRARETINNNNKKDNLQTRRKSIQMT